MPIPEEGLARDLQALLAVVDGLKSDVGRLSGRLEPLCRQLPTKTTGGGANAISNRSALGQAFVAQITELENVRAWIGDILERLEV